MEQSSHSVIQTIGRILLFIIALGVVGALGWILVYFGLRSFIFLTTKPEGSRFSMYENGTVEWFSLIGTTVQPAPGPAGFDSATSTPKIIDATPALTSKDIIVLAQVKNSPTQTQLGVIRNNAFLSLLTLTHNDTNYKASVTAQNDGTIVYDESTSTVATTSLSSWQLYTVPLYTVPQTVVDVGPGFDPVFASSTGVVLAVSPQGLDRVNPLGGRFTLIPQRGITAGKAAISPNALLAVIPNTTSKTLDVFSIDATYTSQVSYIGSVHDAAAMAVTFISPTMFIVQDPGNHFVLYQVANKKIASSMLSYTSS